MNPLPYYPPGQSRSGVEMQPVTSTPFILNTGTTNVAAFGNANMNTFGKIRPVILSALPAAAALAALLAARGFPGYGLPALMPVADNDIAELIEVHGQEAFYRVGPPVTTAAATITSFVTTYSYFPATTSWLGIDHGLDGALLDSTHPVGSITELSWDAAFNLDTDASYTVFVPWYSVSVPSGFGIVSTLPDVTVINSFNFFSVSGWTTFMRGANRRHLVESCIANPNDETRSVAGSVRAATASALPVQKVPLKRA
jgi:hypothetical protein